MQFVQDFTNSLSVQQVTLLLGIVTWLVHLVLNRYHVKRGVSLESRKKLNNFFMRMVTLTVPLAATLATDPNVVSFVHDYLPALSGFFVGYQGFYKLAQWLWEKWQNIKSLVPELPQADTADETPQAV